jgi:ArsR family transcriptional regulator, arsenate/arsenite/antimonite-responsive transcriptional repressor
MREMAAVLKALSDETRLKMLGLLFEAGELCVCDFVEVLGITQSKASRHLRYMVNAGLLADRREGVWSHYRIATAPKPLQKAVLAGMRRIVPPHVPQGLFEALAAWRKRKACDDSKGGCAR